MLLLTLQVTIRPNQILQWRSLNRFKIITCKIRLSLHPYQFKILVTLLSQTQIRTNNNYYHHRQQLNSRLSEGIQLPLLSTLPQPIQPQLFSPPIYPQEPSVIQSELLFQSQPQAPSLIQSFQNLQPSTPIYPQEPSLIQSQLLLQNVLPEPILQPLYSYPVNTLTTLPALLPETIQTIQNPPRILSYSDYVSSTGSLHIVGEVINESFQPIRFVEITATFYDSNNRVIGTDFTFTNPSTLQPGQIAPFDMIIIEGGIPTYLMAYYTLSVDYSDFGLLR